jgi:adenylate cyclase
LRFDSETSALSGEAPAPAPLFELSRLPVPRPSQQQIRSQGERILNSPAFTRSSRSRKLLQYLLTQTLEGNAKRLKQYAIATKALGRGADFDPNIDPIVRLEASKLRRALEDYYLRAGARDRVRISIPKGSYVPAFELCDSLDANPASWAGNAEARASTSPDATLGCERLLLVPFCDHLKNDVGRMLTDGLYEQLTVEISRYRDIALLTQPGEDARLGTTGDPVAAGLKLQARFVLSGSVRPNGEQIRVTARLHDVSIGAVVWGDCFDLGPDSRSGLEAEDEIARRVAGAVADYYGVISYTLGLQSVYSNETPWTVRNAIQRHRYLARVLAEPVYRIARADLELGITRAPYNPMIWSALAHTVFYGNVFGFDQDENWTALVYRLTQRSFELDHKCAFGHVVMALHGLYHRELDDVLQTCKRILQDNPHAPSTKLSAGFFLALAGEWERGVGMLGIALSELLYPPSWAHRVTFLDHYRRKSYLEALYQIDKYHAAENFTPALLRAAALAQLGRRQEAENSLAEVLRIAPRFFEIAPKYFRYLTAFDDILDHLMCGLIKAGLKV